MHLSIFLEETQNAFYILNCVAEIILEYKEDAMPKKHHQPKGTLLDHLVGTRSLLNATVSGK